MFQQMSNKLANIFTDSLIYCFFPLYVVSSFFIPVKFIVSIFFFYLWNSECNLKAIYFLILIV